MTTSLFLWIVGHRPMSVQVLRDASAICDGYPLPLFPLFWRRHRRPANGGLVVAR